MLRSLCYEQKKIRLAGAFVRYLVVRQRADQLPKHRDAVHRFIGYFGFNLPLDGYERPRRRDRSWAVKLLKRSNLDGVTSRPGDSQMLELSAEQLIPRAEWIGANALGFARNTPNEFLPLAHVRTSATPNGHFRR